MRVHVQNIKVKIRIQNIQIQIQIQRNVQIRIQVMMPIEIHTRTSDAKSGTACVLGVACAAEVQQQPCVHSNASAYDDPCRLRRRDPYLFPPRSALPDRKSTPRLPMPVVTAPHVLHTPTY